MILLAFSMPNLPAFLQEALYVLYPGLQLSQLLPCAKADVCQWYGQVVDGRAEAGVLGVGKILTCRRRIREVGKLHSRIQQYIPPQQRRRGIARQKRLEKTRPARAPHAQHSVHESVLPNHRQYTIPGRLLQVVTVVEHLTKRPNATSLSLSLRPLLGPALLLRTRYLFLFRLVGTTSEVIIWRENVSRRLGHRESTQHLAA